MSPRRAVVVGGSMAGMLAARVLAEHLPVSLVERDSLPEGADARRGLPQAAHLHAILARGIALLERFFPGLRRELVDDGAVPVDGGTELGWLGPFGWSPPFGAGRLESVWATRDFLDAHVRARLRQDPRIEWIQGTRVEGLVVSDAGAPAKRVTGVQTHDGRIIDATIVVDATGRGSSLPDWLRSTGVQPPSETEVDSRTAYTSAIGRLARPFPNGWKVLFVLGAPPHVTRGAAIGHVEGGRVVVSFVTVNREEGPRDTADFVEFGRTLRSPVIGALLEGAEWLTPCRTTRSTTNRRRHYESALLPAGLLVVGDALCAFNPTFGQGISVAAMQAEVLANRLRRHGVDAPGLGAKVMAEFGSCVDFPWMMATSQDLQVPGTRGRRPRGHTLVDAYMNRLFFAALRDTEMHLRLSRVFNLVSSPLSLYSPTSIYRALRTPTPVLVLGPVDPPSWPTQPGTHGNATASVAIASRRTSS